MSGTDPYEPAEEVPPMIMTNSELTVAGGALGASPVGHDASV